MTYYQLPSVRSRIIEYCGGHGDDPATCTARFLIGNGRTTSGLGIPGQDAIIPPDRLDAILASQSDIFRSVWDRESLLAILDLDYTNADFPSEAFLDPRGTFAKLEPAYRLIVEELKSFGIRHLSVMTGQGYHFVWRIPLSGKLKSTLRDLYPLHPALVEKYRHDHPFTPETMPLEDGAASSGMGHLLEYLAHRLIAAAQPSLTLPLVVNGLVVGAGKKGREAISLDLSAYGDPLYTRYARCAFSLYEKKTVGYLICLPREGQSLEDLLRWRLDPVTAGELAARTKLAIPEASAGLTRLLKAYLKSPLAAFHSYFYDGQHDVPEEWPYGYDRLDLNALSPCTALPLAQPNHALSIPNNLQNVARVLVSLGWHPRSVAGLVRSKYERDYGWGVNWLVYDAATRADFYIRLFCGLMADGTDDLRDFNCISHQEQGFCPRPWCGHNLADYRERLRMSF
ncbi:MAG: hypothetical protein HY673_18650 [Chloroflexi bacterium]|nr:hypothetical protein [Chloroflexota bacterium]